MGWSMSKIAKHRDFLKERVDTDKMLDVLLAKTILSKGEVDEVKSQSDMYKKNEKLLDIIIKKEKEEKFIAALRDANQRHLANYFLYDGVRNQNVWDDWPLLPTKIQIIDVNCGSLKDLIEIGGGLLDELLAKKVISHRHKQLICSKATDSEKNEAFLDILRRGSMCDYENTIQCLHDSNQNHIAEILDEGGAVMPIHAELQEPLAEIRLAKKITDLLRDRTAEECRRILDMASHKLIDAKIGHSVIFYFYCKPTWRWQKLKKDINSGSLKVRIEKLGKRVDSATNVVIKAIDIRDHDQEGLDRYFSTKVDHFHRIVTSTTDGNRDERVRGFTILNDELYVAFERSAVIEIFNVDNSTSTRLAKVKDLSEPGAIAACEKNNCLYIMDKRRNARKQIIRFYPNGAVIWAWKTDDDDRGRISVNSDGNVVMTVYDKHMLKIYSPEGILVTERTIDFKDIPTTIPIDFIFHAINLDDGNFILCHGMFDSKVHRVCKVDASGNLLRSFGSQEGSDDAHLSSPVYVAKRNDGSILVADQKNHRIILLNSDLTFNAVLFTKEKDGVSFPTTMHVYENNQPALLFLRCNETKSSGGYVLVLRLD